MIEVNSVTKSYKLSSVQMNKRKTKESIIVAARDVSLKAFDGQIYGLLGPNGAGKTTTLRCIATLLTPSAGEIKVNGYDTVKEEEKVRSVIGFLTNDINLDPQFTVDYLFDFFGKLHNMTNEQIQSRKEELFGYFGIDAYKNKKVSELSTGMKQKAAIAVCLVHDPDVIIFDEPTSGLDVITARLVTDYLKKLKDEGKLVIISTHIMSEAEKLCDRIGIIIDGSKVYEGTLEEIYSEFNTRDLEDAFFELYKIHHKEGVA